MGEEVAAEGFEVGVVKRRRGSREWEGGIHALWQGKCVAGH